jgi:hypothetical protein
MTVRVLCLVLALVPIAGVARAQTPAPAPPAASAPSVKPADVPATPPADYSYAVDGRRDPFLSLVNRGSVDSGRGPGRRPEGIAGVLVNEVVVRGIVQSRGGWVAMVGAPNGKTYTVRPGDKLMDGSIRTITSQLVIMMQEVNDPLSIEKQREVRKYLRGGEEVQ